MTIVLIVNLFVLNTGDKIVVKYVPILVKNCKYLVRSAINRRKNEELFSFQASMRCVRPQGSFLDVTPYYSIKTSEFGMNYLKCSRFYIPVVFSTIFEVENIECKKVFILFDIVIYLDTDLSDQAII